MIITGEHNHQTVEDDIEKLRLKSGLRQTVAETGGQMRTLFNRTTALHPAGHMIAFPEIRATLYRSRSRVTPPIPHSVA